MDPYHPSFVVFVILILLWVKLSKALQHPYCPSWELVVLVIMLLFCCCCCCCCCCLIRVFYLFFILWIYILWESTICNRVAFVPGGTQNPILHQFWRSTICNRVAFVPGGAQNPNLHQFWRKTICNIVDFVPGGTQNLINQKKYKSIHLYVLYIKWWMTCFDVLNKKKSVYVSLQKLHKVQY